MKDPNMNLQKEIECIFDRIIFFDDFPAAESFLNMSEHSQEHLAVFSSLFCVLHMTVYVCKE